jgi:hypothetical protein
MRSFRTVVLLLLGSATAAVAAENPSSLSFDQTVDRVVEREHKFVATMKNGTKSNKTNP